MHSRATTIALAGAVALAFADSSVVVLALPELYSSLETSIVGVSWVITAYNLAVALVTLALVRPLRRWYRPWLPFAGLGAFLAGSAACAAAGNLEQLLGFRSVQGVGAALLLAGSLPLLAGLTGSPPRGLALWATAGTLGVAVGPALGGVLTEALGWRAIFAAQAPVAGIALLAALDAGAWRLPAHAESPARHGAANAGLALVFAGLVGALFLGVLLVVTVWELGPLAGAGVVSALPAAALLVRRLAARLPAGLDVAGGAALLAAGLGGLALLPAASPWYAVWALALCGAGIGLALPSLTHASVGSGAEAGAATLSVAARHVGLVVALVLVAPLLAGGLTQAGERAAVNSAAAVLDAPIGLTKKIPIALDLRDSLDRIPAGEIPDVAGAFDRHGATSDEKVAQARDDLLGAIRAALTRGFRQAFGVCALLALLAAATALSPSLREPTAGRA